MSIELRNVSKRFGEVAAVDKVSFSVAEGELVALLGPSGGGKTTVLRMIAGLEMPTDGDLYIRGQRVNAIPVQRRNIGFVFQAFNLLSRTSAVDNVALPLRYAGVGIRERRERAREALDRVGLGHRWDHTPDRLSGGERQRVAIARAIVTKPRLLLCDEPTGNLDQRVGAEIAALFEKLNAETGVTLVMVTHDPALARRARRNIKLVDGAVVHDGAPLEGY